MTRSGQKTIELCLNDKKQQQLKVHDEIEFSYFDENQDPFAARVMALHPFNGFKELYTALFPLNCGYTREIVADACSNGMNQYYSIEEQVQYGVVGTEIDLF